MNRLNYYAVLGVKRTADTGEIRRAYVQRLRSTHPDIGQSSAYPPARLEDIQRAYLCLRNSETRSAYDDELRAHELARTARQRRVQRRLILDSAPPVKISRIQSTRLTEVNRSRWRRALFLAVVTLIVMELIKHS